MPAAELAPPIRLRLFPDPRVRQIKPHSLAPPELPPPPRTGLNYSFSMAAASRASPILPNGNWVAAAPNSTAFAGIP